MADGVLLRRVDLGEGAIHAGRHENGVVAKPAIPAHNPENTYTRNFTVEAFTPAYVLAVWLSPTDSMNSPIAVLRVSTTVSANIARLSHTGNGKPRRLPLPM